MTMREAAQKTAGTLKTSKTDLLVAAASLTVSRGILALARQLELTNEDGKPSLAASLTASQAALATAALVRLLLEKKR